MKQRSTGIDDGSKKWKLSYTQCKGVMMERDFFHGVLQHKERLLCKSDLKIMRLKLEVKGLPQNRCVFFILLLNALMKQLLDCLNESLRLKKAMQRGS